MKKKFICLITFFFIYLNNYSFIEKINEFSCHQSGISSLIFTTDNRYIITGGLDGRINIIDFKKNNIIETLNNINAVESIDVSFNNKYLLSGDRENGVRLWDMKNFELLKFWEMPFRQIFTLNFSVKNGYFIAGGINGYEIINFKNFNIIKKESIKNYAVRDAKFSYNDKFLVIASGNKIKIFKIDKDNFLGKIIKNNMANFKYRIELEFQDLIYSIDISKNSQYLAVAGNSTYVTLIRLEDFAHIWSIKPHNSLIWDVKFSPDNKILITAGSDRILNFIDIKTKKIIYSDNSHPDEIYAIDISSDYNYLSTGCKDGKLRIFRLHFNKQIDFYLIKIIIFIIITLIFLFIIFFILKLKRKKSVKDWEI